MKERKQDTNYEVNNVLTASSIFLLQQSVIVDMHDDCEKIQFHKCVKDNT